MVERIADKKTTDDWKADRSKFTVGGDRSVWQDAFKSYFCARLETRYLNPIKIIRNDSSLSKSGEGFSIMTIICSMIEFLQSTMDGKSYIFLKKGQKLGQFEYSNSSIVFKTFLTAHKPFSTYFTSSIVAHDFYVNVRCALLHEARTKNGWRILAEDLNQKAVDIGQKIIYRNNFQDHIEMFIKDYGVQLENNVSYQEAFIRKFDSLV